MWRSGFSKVGAWRHCAGNWNRGQLSFDLNFRTQTIVLSVGAACPSDAIVLEVALMQSTCNLQLDHTRDSFFILSFCYGFDFYNVIYPKVPCIFKFHTVSKLVLGWFVRARREIASLTSSGLAHKEAGTENNPMCGCGHLKGCRFAWMSLVGVRKMWSTLCCL